MFRKKRLQKKSSKHICNMKRAIARSTAAADYGSILYLILDSFTDSFSEVAPRIRNGLYAGTYRKDMLSRTRIRGG